MAELQPIRTRQARALGRSRRELAQQPWTRPHRGVVALDSLDLDDPLERIRCAIPLLEPGSVLTGWAAAYWQGNTMLDGVGSEAARRPVMIANPGFGQHRPRDGIAVTRRSMLPGETTTFDGVPTATLTRAIYDEALETRGLAATVAVLDMGISTVLDQARTTIHNLHHLVDAHVKTRGIVRVRQALGLVNSRSASPLESRTRVIATRAADLKDLRVNLPIFDMTEKLIGIADLVDLDSGLIIESDGSGHREENRHAADNRREEAFEQVGATVCRITSLDHRTRNEVSERINAAHLRARQQPPPNWLIDPPEWWFHWTSGKRWR